MPPITTGVSRSLDCFTRLTALDDCTSPAQVPQVVVAVAVAVAVVAQVGGGWRGTPKVRSIAASADTRPPTSGMPGRVMSWKAPPWSMRSSCMDLCPGAQHCGPAPPNFCNRAAVGARTWPPQNKHLDYPAPMAAIFTCCRLARGALATATPLTMYRKYALVHCQDVPQGRPQPFSSPSKERARPRPVVAAQLPAATGQSLSLNR